MRQCIRTPKKKSPMGETLEEGTWKLQRTNIIRKMSVVNTEEIFSVEHLISEKITGSDKKPTPGRQRIGVAM
jgi:hypothetical protein